MLVYFRAKAKAEQYFDLEDELIVDARRASELIQIGHKNPFCYVHSSI